MKILYLECEMGASGDMLMAALLELLPEPDAFLAKLNGMGLDGVRVTREKSVKCGIAGTHVNVLLNGKDEEESEIHGHGHHHHHHEHEHEHHHEHEHEHNALDDILHTISHLNLPQSVRANAAAVYKLLAEAESHAHGRPVGLVHFHEVGALDAVADIAGVCLAVEELGADKIAASPVKLGRGTVRCAHGVVPVPAPATAYLLRGVPVESGQIEGELCTPTGAALLRNFCADFGPMPLMSVEKIGYGMGKKDFPAANCVRAFWGELTDDSSIARGAFWGDSAGNSAQESAEKSNGEAAELCCNLDDMTGEAIGFACETLRARGALDVFVTPVQMKKSRPGVLLTCICEKERSDEFAKLLLKYTTTFGVRRHDCQRYTLQREMSERETPYGKIRVKKGHGYGVQKEKPEYDDAAKAAAKNGVTLEEILKN